LKLRTSERKFYRMRENIIVKHLFNLQE